MAVFGMGLTCWSACQNALKFCLDSYLPNRFNKMCWNFAWFSRCGHDSN